MQMMSQVFSCGQGILIPVPFTIPKPHLGEGNPGVPRPRVPLAVTHLLQEGIIKA